MSTCNNSISQPLIFVLARIPGLEFFYGWFSVLCFLICVIVIMGNVTIACIIWMEKSLHEPMFLLLAILSVVDLCLVSVTVPRILGIFWMNAKEIRFDACLTQMFFIPSFYVVESGILLAMAFDRFVAIWYPLRYITILDVKMLIKMALAILVRAMAVLTPAPILVRRVKSFQTHIIAYCYCAYIAVVMTACGDISHHIIYGLMVIAASVGFDLFLSFCPMDLSFMLSIGYHLGKHKAKLSALAALIFVLSVFFILLLSFLSWPRF